MNKNVIDIACTLDEEYVQHCTVMLCSIFLNNPNTLFKIHIIKEKGKSYSFLILTSFIKKKGHYVKLIEIDISFTKQTRLDNHITKAAYYRLKLPSILKNIPKVLYLDPDIIITTNISKLWHLNIDDYSLFAAADPELECINRKSSLNIPDNFIYFNSGVLLFNLKKWRLEKLEIKTLNYLKENATKLQFHDQDALNAVLHTSVQIISSQWNLVTTFFKPNMHWEDENYIVELKKNAKIIHFTGSSKPWHLENKHPYKHLYYHYLKQTPWKNYSPLWDFIKRKSKKYFSFR